MQSETSEFEKKIYVEHRKIETDRFDEGIRRQHDPRNDGDYDLDWIIKNAVEFANKWRNCFCRTCVKVKDCGFKLAIDCNYFEKDENKS